MGQAGGDDRRWKMISGILRKKFGHEPYEPYRGRQGGLHTFSWYFCIRAGGIIGHRLQIVGTLQEAAYLRVCSNVATDEQVELAVCALVRLSVPGRHRNLPNTRHDRLRRRPRAFAR